MMKLFFTLYPLFAQPIVSVFLYDHSLFSFCFHLILIGKFVLFLFFLLAFDFQVRLHFRSSIIPGRFDLLQIGHLNFENLDLRSQIRKDHIFDILLGHSSKFAFYSTNKSCKRQIHTVCNDVYLSVSTRLFS